MKRFAVALLLGCSLAACTRDAPTGAGTTAALRTLQSARSSVTTGCLACAFGPAIYTRSTGQPLTKTSTFAADPTAAYLIDIDDGGGEGADGSVTLNSAVLLAPRTSTDIGPRHIRGSISLLSQNVLEVRLTGKSGSTLTVSLLRAITDLGTLGGSESVAYGINASGQVVGSSDALPGLHAFFWQNGTMSDLNAFGHLPCDFTFAAATGINDSGDIVGWSTQTASSCSGNVHAILWHNGTMNDVDANHAVDESWAQDISPSGRIVGYRLTEPSDLLSGLVWQNGASTDLGSLGGSRTRAQAINAAGQVVGSSDVAGFQHAFRWQNGTMTDLGTLGGTQSAAYGINDAGQVVGTIIAATGLTRAFLWQKGTMTGLGTLGGSGSVAYGINAAGQAVGWSSTTDGSMHAVLWTTT